MRFLITITLEGGDTAQVWAETENAGRIACNILASANGIVSIELMDFKTKKLLLQYGEVTTDQ